MAGNGNSLVELIKAVASSGPQPKSAPSQGQATDAKNPGPALSAGIGDSLELAERTFVSPIPPEMEVGYTNQDPDRPQGALECLSVVQIAGAPGGQAPVDVRTFQVKDPII